MIKNAFQQMVTFHQTIEDTLICHVLIAFTGDPGHKDAGWYRKEFNRPQDIRDDQHMQSSKTTKEVESQMRKQPKVYGVCDIMDLFHSKEQPLRWERAESLPPYARRADLAEIEKLEKAKAKLSELLVDKSKELAAALDLAKESLASLINTKGTKMKAESTVRKKYMPKKKPMPGKKRK